MNWEEIMRYEPRPEVRGVRPPKEPVTTKEYFDHNLKCGDLPVKAGSLLGSMWTPTLDKGCGKSDWSVIRAAFCSKNEACLRCVCGLWTLVEVIPDDPKQSLFTV